MHPVPPSTRAEVDGRSLGDFDDSEFQGLVKAAESVVARSGLFEWQSEVEFDYLERYDDPAELLEDIKDGWDGCHAPPELEARIRDAGGSAEMWERGVLRQVRAASKSDRGTRSIG